MLPYLKNRDDGVGQGPVESIQRKHDEDAGFDMLDAVAEDLMDAIERKDKKRLRAALEAFADHIQSTDEVQDQQTMEGE
jgi:tRNA A37 N6-isopentenylltransferase MiaA